MELREGSGHHSALTMENVFGSGLLKFRVPNQSHSVGIVGGVLVIIVGGQKEFRVLRGPVQGRHAAVPGPPFVVEPSVQGDALV